MSEEYTDWKEKREEKSRQLIKDFADLVNGSADSKALQDQFTREHRTLQQSMFREILKLICMISKLDDMYIDGRNEQSKQMAIKLIAGYAEIIKREELERLKGYGYSPDEAETKAEEYKKAVIEKPESYLNVGCI
jgi:hypothetical protein